MSRWVVILLCLSFSEGLLAYIPSAGGSFVTAEGVMLAALVLMLAGNQSQRRQRQQRGKA